jgi:hypothetical protein
MIMDPNSVNTMRGHFAGDLALAYAGSGTSGLPRRPDASVINAAIPLFYIGRNAKGLWVAREAEGRIGGIFLSRRGAVRFARESCESTGCATMFVPEPLELEFDNHGNPSAAERATAHPAFQLFAFIARIITAAGKFFGRTARVLESVRMHRKAIETELFGGRYTLNSKNDDDLPIVV